MFHTHALVSVDFGAAACSPNEIVIANGTVDAQTFGSNTDTAEMSDDAEDVASQPAPNGEVVLTDDPLLSAQKRQFLKQWWCAIFPTRSRRKLTAPNGEVVLTLRTKTAISQTMVRHFPSMIPPKVESVCVGEHLDCSSLVVVLAAGLPLPAIVLLMIGYTVSSIALPTMCFICLNE